MAELSEILGDFFKQVPEDIKKKYKDVDLVNSSNYVEKAELETANNAIKQYKKDIAKRDLDLTNLQGKVKDNEVLNTEIEALKLENSTKSAAYEAELSEIKFNTALDKALDSYKLVDKDLVIKILDKEKINLNGKDFIGLKEQMESMQKERSYLFAEETAGGTGTIGGTSSNNPTPTNDEENGIGATLGKQQADKFKQTETLDKFFN